MKNKELENLRALAIVMTLLAHLSFFTHKPNDWYAYTIQNIAQFWGGVEIFFVISGFVICKQLDTSISWGRGWSENRASLNEFFIKRIFRILPQAFFWAAFVLGCSWYFDGIGKFGDFARVFWHFLASVMSYENIYLTFDVAPQLSVYWSLSIEEQFYIILPLLLIAFSKKKAIFLLIFAAIFQMLLPRPVDQSKLIFMVRYDAIILGCLLYLWSTTKSYQNLKERCAARYHALFALQIALILSVMLIPVHLKGVWFMVGILDIVCFFIVAISSFQLGSFAFRPFANSIFGYVGSRSYALYLCHIPVAFFLLSLDALALTTLAPAEILDHKILWVIIMIFVSAEFSYRLIEAPLREKGRSLIYTKK